MLSSKKLCVRPIQHLFSPHSPALLMDLSRSTAVRPTIAGCTSCTHDQLAVRSLRTRRTSVAAIRHQPCSRMSCIMNIGLPQSSHPAHTQKRTSHLPVAGMKNISTSHLPCLHQRFGLCGFPTHPCGMPLAWCSDALRKPALQEQDQRLETMLGTRIQNVRHVFPTLDALCAQSPSRGWYQRRTGDVHQRVPPPLFGMVEFGAEKCHVYT